MQSSSMDVWKFILLLMLVISFKLNTQHKSQALDSEPPHEVPPPLPHFSPLATFISWDPNPAVFALA
jgi:hypothetical protein